MKKEEQFQWQILQNYLITNYDINSSSKATAISTQSGISSLVGTWCSILTLSYQLSSASVSLWSSLSGLIWWTCRHPQCLPGCGTPQLHPLPSLDPQYYPGCSQYLYQLGYTGPQDPVDKNCKLVTENKLRLKLCQVQVQLNLSF